MPTEHVNRLLEFIKDKKDQLGLTDSDIKELSKYLQDPDVKEALYEAPADDMRAMLNAVGNTEFGQFMRNKMLEQQRLPMDLAETSNIADMVDAVVGIGIAADQISTSNREIGKLSPPTPPSVGNIDPQLLSAIRRSRQQVDSPFTSPEVGMAKRQAADDYMTARGQAKVASGGQAGSYGSMAQGLYNARQNANLGVSALASQRRQADMANLSGLLQTKAISDSYADRNKISLYGANLDKYIQEAQSAGTLGAHGRLNFVNKFGQLLGAGAYPMAKMATNKYIDKYNTMLGDMGRIDTRYNGYKSMFGPDIAEYALKADLDLSKNYTQYNKLQNK